MPLSPLQRLRRSGLEREIAAEARAQAREFLEAGVPADVVEGFLRQSGVRGAGGAAAARRLLGLGDAAGGPLSVVVSSGVPGLSLSVEVVNPEEIDEMAEVFVESLRAALAVEIDRALRGPSTLWPKRGRSRGHATDRSRRAFQSEDVHHAVDFEIEVHNLASNPRTGFVYPQVVNNAQRLRGGSRNPNFEAVQRTIRQRWNRISGRALDQAVAEAVQE